MTFWLLILNDRRSVNNYCICNYRHTEYVMHSLRATEDALTFNGFYIFRKTVHL